MSAPHWLLVAWWLIAAIVVIPSIILTWRARKASQKSAVLSYLRGNPTGRYKLQWPSAMLPPAIFWIWIILIVLLFIGILVLLWMSNWTRPLLLNLHVFGVLFATMIAALGLSSAAFASMPLWLRSASVAIRAALILLGAVLMVLMLYVVVADLAFQGLVVEGRIERTITRYGRRLFAPEYFVVIRGRRHKATREAIESLTIGDQVRAELGAGSKVIFRTQPIAAQSRDAS
jgi:hypothetical protein